MIPSDSDPVPDLVRFLDASPSPWHAAEDMARRLAEAGYGRLGEAERWRLAPGGRHFVQRGASLIALRIGRCPLAENGLTLLGAHTDSPGLRLKPRAAHKAEGLLRLGVEIYGGPILATFSDRELGLAGRVFVKGEEGIEARLLHLDKPLLRLPNLAVHMNREVNDKGLKFDKQAELPLILGVAGAGEAEEHFRSLLSGALQVEVADILTWELAACDTQKAALWGADQEFIASGRLDNLASCHAGLAALLAAGGEETCVCAFFDHEEVGSESSAGAAGSFVSDVLTRLMATLGLDAEDGRRAFARSFFISADMAHAWQPNFPAAYEPQHRLMVNGGPAIKVNANQRYGTGADSAARFLRLCERAGVPCQQYAHRSDLACGSTIGPTVAARLGLPVVDVGAPLWAMHSIRESAGVLDHGYLVRALGAAFEKQ